MQRSKNGRRCTHGTESRASAFGTFLEKKKIGMNRHCAIVVAPGIDEGEKGGFCAKFATRMHFGVQPCQGCRFKYPLYDNREFTRNRDYSRRRKL